MAQKDNIYFIEKNDDSNITDSEAVWQDAYTEVVAYEEDVEENSQFNITYVTANNTSNNEMYDTAMEDNTQYYSVIDTSSTNELVNVTLTQEDNPNQSQLVFQENSIDNNVTVVQYSPNTLLSEDESGSNLDNITVENKTVNIDDSCNITTEDDDQVILYKVQDSNELFAVQIARDSDGNMQKYQYKVRQNEDGQLEAVPGTIRLQPEGTDQIIYEDFSNKTYENELKEISKDFEQMKSLENTKERSETVFSNVEIINTQNLDSSQLIKQEGSIRNVAEENISEYFKDTEKDAALTGESVYFEEEEEEELKDDFTDVEYLQEEFEEEENERYISLQENEPVVTSESEGLQYSEENQVQVLTNVILQEKSTKSNESHVEKSVVPQTNQINTTPKQILNKMCLNTEISNENIELKQVPNSTCNKTNKLTFLIVTHPINQSPVQSQKPQTVRSTLQSNKKYRSILRHASAAVTNKISQPVFKATCKQIIKRGDIVTSIPSNNTKTFNKPSVFKTTVPIQNVKHENKGPRQPRKQVIRPVDREGSEIIIQMPEEKTEAVETFDLDTLSDEEYSPKPKQKLKKIISGKKRGRKPTKHLLTDKNQIQKENLKDIIKTESENEIKINEENIKLELLQNRTPARKRGRPRLVEKKTILVEKEIIIAQNSKNGISGRGRGRPKFIRTQKKYTNKFKQSVKQINVDLKEIKNEDNDIITIRRRGRPPKKYSPEIELVKKRKPKISFSNSSLESDDNAESVEKSTEETPKVKKLKVESTVDSVDNIMNEIHGNTDSEETPIIEALGKNENEEEAESLLSILETPDTTVKKEDVLERALKGANIINPSEEIIETKSFLGLKNETIVQTSVEQTSAAALDNSFQLESIDSTKEKENFFREQCDEIKLNKIEEKLSTNVDEKSKVDNSIISVVSKLNEEKKVNNNNDEMKSNSKNGPYKCLKCKQSFPTFLLYKKHKLEHEPKSKFNCSKCFNTYSLESALKYHEKRVHSNSLAVDINCTECSQTFKTISLFRNHQLLSHKNYSCDRCPEKFTKRSELHLHIRNHIKNNLQTDNMRKLRRSTVTKTEFSEIINNIDNKNKIKRQTLTKSSDETKTKLDNAIIHRCNICFKTFRQLAHLVMHRDVHNKPTCANCGEVFPFRHTLSEHMRRYCLKSPNRKSVAIIQNNGNKKSLLNESKINKNKRLSLANNSASTITFDCDKCKKMFKSKLFLNNHMKTHIKTPNKHHLNNTRSQNYTSRKTLSVYTSQTKSMGRNIRNTTIGPSSINEQRQSNRKSVPTKKLLTIKCEKCNLNFATHTGLFKHLSTHSDDIKMKCEYCHLQFETQELLVKHTKEHVKNVNVCDNCDKIFKTEDELKEHKLITVCCKNKIKNNINKNDLESTIKMVNIDHKKIPYGGIPLSDKMKKAILKRKLAMKNVS